MPQDKFKMLVSYPLGHGEIDPDTTNDSFTNCMSVRKDFYSLQGKFKTNLYRTEYTYTSINKHYSASDPGYTISLLHEKSIAF